MITRSSIDPQAPATTTCRSCGHTAPAATARVTGVWSGHGGQATWDCPSCARTHIADIEAGLNRSHW